MTSRTASAPARRKSAIVVAVSLGLLAALLASAPERGEAKSRFRTRSTQVAEGLVFTRILDRNGPKRIKILEIDMASSLSLDVALAGGRIPGLQKTSSIAADHGAIAAINGTYFLPSGRPIGVFVEDADFKATPLVPGNAFGITADGQQTFIGKPKTRIDAYRPASGSSFDIDGWNASDPALGEIGGFTPAGGSAAKPPKHACSARLYPSSEVMWSQTGAGFEGDYLVDKTKCDRSRLRRGGGVVLSATSQSAEAESIASFFQGETARIAFSLGWPNVLDAIAGNPVLVEDGVNIGYQCSSAFCKKQPRTGIGVTADRKLLLVTVDGRQKGYSIGMNLYQFGKLFESLGAVYALNLDGGGSTTMYLEGKVRNRPSDSAGERYVGSAVLLLEGADLDEPTPQPYTSPTSAPAPLPTPSPTLPAPSPSPSPSLVGSTGSVAHTRVVDGHQVAGLEVGLTLLDPASTGGLLEAMLRGDVPGSKRVPPSLRWAVRVFRSR